MAIKKIIILNTDTGVITTLGVAFDGPAQAVTFALVGGFQSFNNSEFTLNATTGELTLPGTLTEGRYYFRYRVTLDSNTFEFEEGVGIVDVSSELTPTVSGPLEYEAAISPGDIVATVASTFTSAKFSMIPGLSTGTVPPDTAGADFEIDETTGEISWTGDGTASNKYDYNYDVTAKSGGAAGCFSASVAVDISPEVEELDTAADCAFVDNLTNSDENRIQRNGGANNQFIPFRADLNDPDVANDANSAGASVQNREGLSFARSDLGRCVHKTDTSGVTGTLNMFINASSTVAGRKFYILYTTAPEEAVTNPHYDMPSWNVLGFVIPDPAGSFYTILADDLPRDANLRVGVMIEEDYLDDIASLNGQTFSNNNKYRLANVVVYECP